MNNDYYSQKLNSLSIDELILELKDKSFDKLKEAISLLVNEDEDKFFSMMVKMSGLSHEAGDISYIFDNLTKGNEDFEYQDNERVCLKGDEFSERLYKVSRSRGCCGSLDDEVFYKGKTYKVGFNYGH